MLPGCSSPTRCCRAVGPGRARASRLRHPNLAEVLEIGVCEHWPFALYDAEGVDTLAERLQRQDLGSQEAATLFVEAWRGLAFAHDGGVAHRDLQPYMVLLREQGGVQLMGFEVALAAQPDVSDAPESGIAQRTSVDALQLRALRKAAHDDVLAMGLLLHWAAGRASRRWTSPTSANWSSRLPPRGRELVRLPWTTPQPVPEALRAIGNRATDRQERQRYRSARRLAARARRLAAGRRRGRRRAVGAVARPPAQRRRVARVARRRRTRGAAGADGPRAHQRTGRGGAAGPGVGLRAAALGEQRAGARRAGRGQRPGADHPPRHRDARPGRRAPRRAGACATWPGPLAGSRRRRHCRACSTNAKRAGRVAAGAAPGGLRRRGGAPGDAAAEPGPADRRVPLSRRSCSRSAG